MVLDRGFHPNRTLPWEYCQTQCSTSIISPGSNSKARDREANTLFMCNSATLLLDIEFVNIFVAQRGPPVCFSFGWFGMSLVSLKVLAV